MLLAALSGVVSSAAGAVSSSPSRDIQRVANSDRPGTAWSVRVADVPLISTEQVFARDTSLAAAAQVEQMLEELETVLSAAGGSLRQLVRLNVYVADDSVTPVVDAVLARRLAETPPAVTLVRSPLVVPGALVACDAVAVGAGEPKSVVIAGRASVMPAGGKLFVSGQARRAADFRSSVAQTMESLHASVAHVGRSKSDIVHVKGFITPFADHAVAKVEIARSFASGSVPPIVLIEWLADTAAEIEIVVSHPSLAAKPGESLTFLPLPGMSTSPYYSRVVAVAAGTPLIFLAGMEGGNHGSAREQWQRTFAQLATALLDSGSSFRHMVKATYFLSDAKARQSLGEIRGVYYDPARPPSASALDVKSIGRPGRLVALDMIAVPSRTEPPK